MLQNECVKKSKTPNAKPYTVGNSIYMKCPTGKFTEIKGKPVVGQKWEQKLTANGPGEAFTSDGNILKPGCSDGCTTL